MKSVLHLYSMLLYNFWVTYYYFPGNCKKSNFANIFPGFKSKIKSAQWKVGGLKVWQKNQEAHNLNHQF